MTSQSAEELISVLEEQETRLVLESFTHDDAWRLGTLLVEMARERGAPVAIDIRSASQQLFHCALPGSSADNDAWIDRKRRVVERYGASSFLVGARFRARAPPSMSLRASTSTVLPPTGARSRCVPDPSALGPSVPSRFRACPKRTTTR